MIRETIRPPPPRIHPFTHLPVRFPPSPGAHMPRPAARTPIPRKDPPMHIALINALHLTEPDPDEAPLLAALRAAGHTARSIAWDDPSGSPQTDPGAFDACVIRATWNYHRQPEAFARWVRHASERTRLINPPQTVLWNMHKRYLIDLEHRRIPIVPTLWADRGADPDALARAVDKGWSRIVIKPSVSAGSRDTRVFDLSGDDDATGRPGARRFLAESVAREDTMVQRFMPAVERGGEVSVIVIAGAVSHAIVKHPRFAGEHERTEALPEVSQAQRRFALAVLDACRHATTFARVDLMSGDRGEIMLSELELIEPSLYFGHAPGSADRMAAAIAGAVRAGPAMGTAAGGGGDGGDGGGGGGGGATASGPA